MCKNRTEREQALRQWLPCHGEKGKSTEKGGPRCSDTCVPFDRTVTMVTSFMPVMIFVGYKVGGISLYMNQIGLRDRLKRSLSVMLRGISCK